MTNCVVSTSWKRKRPDLSRRGDWRPKKRKRNDLAKWQITLRSGRRGDDERNDLIHRLNGMSLHVIIFKIFTYLDYDSLVNAEKVSTQWRLILADELIWKKLLERKMSSDSTWRNFYGYLQVQRVPAITSGPRIQRNTCDQIAELERHFIGLVTSSIGLLRSSVRVITQVLDLFRHFGFGQLAHVGHELDRIDSDSDD